MSDYDYELVKIADYVLNYHCTSEEALSTARYSLLDAIGCGLLALQTPECSKHMGPIVPGTIVPNGVHIPGTQYVLDPIQAAFNISCMNRWLDFNDTFLAREWGHPSDNLGAILSVAEYISNVNISQGKKSLFMIDVLYALIKSYEIQGVFSLENSFNVVGLDHVVLVKVASTAVSSMLMGGDKETILAALSQAWIDGQALRTYRHWPNTGSRKCWAAADAVSCAVRLSLMSIRGEMGYHTPLTAPRWGFYDVLYRGRRFELPRPFEDYIIQNILFKVSFPAEFHAQTAVEAAVKLYPLVCGRLDQIKHVYIHTHLSAIQIISKVGPLYNESDRDHCLQYMVAVALIFGDLKVEYYDDSVAIDPRIDTLREKMIVNEDECYTFEYLNPNERSISNAIQIEFNDGSLTDKFEVKYPLGHRRRRKEAIPLFEQKFAQSVRSRFPKKWAGDIIESCLRSSLDEFCKLTVPEFMRMFII